MSASALMVQGTASSVGKSLVVTALCRILRQDGFDVVPFKAQNMSNNSFATTDGLEIGRAQAVQAEAAGVEPSVDMNPILLKPESDRTSQVVVLGRPVERVQARDYYARRQQMWHVVTGALDRLRSQHGLVVIEGAGSPAEVNLRDRDIANMQVALYCRAPVLLVADIDRGGVFASVVGTLELLRPEERDLVKGIVINKFRGDVSLLTPGLDWLATRTGVAVVGVLPYMHDIGIAEEDSVSLERRRALKSRADFLIDVAVIGLPHISNFDDFDPLEREASVRLRYVETGDVLGEPDLIVIPGTKSTIADLDWLRRSGYAAEITQRAAAGASVIGICGGYQMLGSRVADPEAVESEGRTATERAAPERTAAGLDLLPVSTVFHRVKSTNQVSGRVAGAHGLLREACGSAIYGYEIHMGRTDRTGGSAAFAIEGRGRTAVEGAGGESCDGCLSDDGNVFGTYIHGLFESTPVRRSVLEHVARRKGVSLPVTPAGPTRQERYDRLALRVRAHLNMEAIHGLIPSGLINRR